MNPLTRLTACCAIAVFATGCDLLDRLEGKSPGREHIENIAALAAAAPPMTVAAHCARTHPGARTGPGNAGVSLQRRRVLICT